jgi:hypothetical protein
MEVREIAGQMSLPTKLKWLRSCCVVLARYGLHTLRDIQVMGIVEDVLMRLDRQFMQHAA